MRSDRGLAPMEPQRLLASQKSPATQTVGSPNLHGEVWVKTWPWLYREYLGIQFRQQEVQALVLMNLMWLKI